jgi:hypothetical protein
MGIVIVEEENKRLVHLCQDCSDLFKDIDLPSCQVVELQELLPAQEGYQTFLHSGEIIKDGDEYQTIDGSWVKSANVGQAMIDTLQYRRKASKEKPTEDSEYIYFSSGTVQEGDEYRTTDGSWLQSFNWDMPVPTCSKNLLYRRHKASQYRYLAPHEALREGDEYLVGRTWRRTNLPRVHLGYLILRTVARSVSKVLGIAG